MKIQDVLTRLKEGNSRFVIEQLKDELRGADRRKSLLMAQNPFAVVLSCSDSRVVPELIFDTGLGELFVVRVAGNVANKSSVASIEYAIAHLAVKVIVVLGHQNCGAVTAAVKGGDSGENLNHLLSHISPAIAASAKMASVDEVIKTNTELTSKKLMHTSKIIKNAVENDEVVIVPAYYSLDSGEVDWL